MYFNDLSNQTDTECKQEKLVDASGESVTIPDRVDGPEGPEEQSDCEPDCIRGESRNSSNEEWSGHQKRGVRSKNWSKL